MLMRDNIFVEIINSFDFDTTYMYNQNEIMSINNFPDMPCPCSFSTFGADFLNIQMTLATNKFKSGILNVANYINKYNVNIYKRMIIIMQTSN